MAIFDSSTLAAGRLDQRKETKTSRLGLGDCIAAAVRGELCGGEKTGDPPAHNTHTYMDM